MRAIASWSSVVGVALCASCGGSNDGSGPKQVAMALTKWVLAWRTPGLALA